MDSGLQVCLLNDSFPPTVDGVANAVLNYASIIDKKYGDAYVVVPKYPDAEDDEYPFDVLRYKSFDVAAVKPYRVGYPLDSHPIKKLVDKPLDIIHTHCPIASAILGRNLRKQTGVPLILTYHTKFDIDFHNVIKNKFLCENALKLLLDNINACDDVWAVSNGAADNLRGIGYEGSITVMRNGVDFPKCRASDVAAVAVREKYALSGDCLNLIFVGRIKWYKGLKIILDAVDMCRKNEVAVKMLFVGDGPDASEVSEYAKSLGLDERYCVFVGPINDRELLRAYYTACDLFVFPSSFDTNGLVVSEAAACSVPSVVLRGSCAAEEIVDGVNGFLCNENPASLYLLLRDLELKKDKLRQVGEAAADSLYFSWEASVEKAVERYRFISELAKKDELPDKKADFDALFSIVSAFQGNGRRMERLKCRMSSGTSRWFHSMIGRMGYKK